MTPPKDAQHIPVFGISFCGSTYFTHCMGALPGVASLGETHWLIDDLSPTFSRSCKVCGDECELFAKAKDYEAGSLYERLSREFDGERIVTADKDASLYKAHGLTALAGIVLYRPPDVMYPSYVRNMGRAGEADILSREDYLLWWSEFYLALLAGTDSICIDFEKFRESPHSYMSEICGYFALSYNPDFLNYHKYAGHYIGGNYNFNERLRQGDYSVVELKPADPAPDADEPLPGIVCSTLRLLEQNEARWRA